MKTILAIVAFKKNFTFCLKVLSGEGGDLR
jgi:hypothetical protein